MSDNKIDQNAGVLGFATDQRSQRDLDTLSQFSCNKRENYEPGITTSDMFIEPRSIKDQMLLATFNPCICAAKKEAYMHYIKK
jgi:hypothetical protein